MKNKKINKKIITTILATSAVWTIALAGLNYLSSYNKLNTIQFKMNNTKTTILVPCRTLKKGEIIKKTDLKEIVINANNLVPNSLNQYDKIVGKKVQHNLYVNEPITREDCISTKIADNKMELYNIPIDLTRMHNNKLKANDYVNIKLLYSKTNNNVSPLKKTDVVVAKVLIQQITDNRGVEIKNTDEQLEQKPQIPAYITILCPSEKTAILDDARKFGYLNIYKCLDPASKPIEETYIPSWNLEKPQTEGTN